MAANTNPPARARPSPLTEASPGAPQDRLGNEILAGPRSKDANVALRAAVADSKMSDILKTPTNVLPEHLRAESQTGVTPTRYSHCRPLIRSARPHRGAE